MNIQFHGTNGEYTPPTVVTLTDEVLVGQFRGHAFRVRKQQKVNNSAANYTLKYRGH